VTSPPEGACPVCGGTELVYSPAERVWLCVEHDAPAVAARAASPNGSAGDDLLIDMREAMLHAHDPIPHLIDPIAVRGLVTVLVGRHSSMKSWLMICAGAAVQADREAIAGYAVATAPVLYIDAEMGPRLMARRFAAGGLAYDAFHVADGFRLRLPQSKAQIAALIERTGAQLVVMDSLRRLAPGAREDRSDDMSPIMAVLAELSRELDVAIVLIHHRSTKEGAAETRGSSSIEDQADIVLAFEHVKDDPHRARRRLRTIKFRPDEEPPATWVSVGYCGSAFTIDAADPFEGAEADPRPQVLVADAERHAEAIARDGGWPPRRLAAELGVGSNSGTYTRTWKALEAAGWHASGASSARLVHPPGSSPYDPLSPLAARVGGAGGESSSAGPDPLSQSQIFDRPAEARNEGGESGGESADLGAWEPYEPPGGYEEPDDQWWDR
jgi:hypothetical protein